MSRRPAGAGNFLKLRRSLDEHLLERWMTWNEFAMVVWLCIRASPANGVVRTSWVQLEGETRLSANHAEQICRALRRKRYVWYPRHRGRRGAHRLIEIAIDKYPTADGRYTDLSDRFAGGAEAAAPWRSPSGRADVPETPSTHPGRVLRRGTTPPTELGPDRARRAPIQTELGPDLARRVPIRTELGPDRTRPMSTRTDLARTEREADPHGPPPESRPRSRRARGFDAQVPTELTPDDAPREAIPTELGADRARHAPIQTELARDRARHAPIRTELDTKTLEKSRGSVPGRLRLRIRKRRERDRDRDPECARAQERRNGGSRTEARAHTDRRERPAEHDVAPGWREDMTVPVAIREAARRSAVVGTTGHDGASASLPDAEGRSVGSKATAASGSRADTEGNPAGSQATAASGPPPGGAQR